MRGDMIIGKDFARACETGKTGVVHSVFERTANIRADGLLTILCDDMDVMPSCLIVKDALPGTWAKHMNIGDKVIFTPETLYVNNAPIVGRINYAKRWNRLTDAKINRLQKPSKKLLLQNLRTTEAYLNNLFEPTIKIPNAESFNPLDIIGLGSGLTPAGDDFLAGMLFSMIFMEKLYGVKNPRLPALIDSTRRNLHMTGEISRHFLNYALEGEWGQNTENFLVALARDSDENLKVAIDKKLTFGASSGADELAGCLFAAREYVITSQDIDRHL